jgi:hypothetical protein
VFIRSGEQMTEAELAEHLSTLLGFNADAASCEPTIGDDELPSIGDLIDKRLPQTITADLFTEHLLGLGPCSDIDSPRDQDVVEQPTRQTTRSLMTEA